MLVLIVGLAIGAPAIAQTIPPYINGHEVVAIDTPISLENLTPRARRFPDLFEAILRSCLEKYGFTITLQGSAFSTTNAVLDRNHYDLNTGEYWARVPLIGRPLIMYTGSYSAYNATGVFTWNYRQIRVKPTNSDVYEVTFINDGGDGVTADFTFFSFNTTNDDWNLPFNFTSSNDDWNLTEVDAYPVPKRVKALDAALFSLPSNPSTVCGYFVYFIRRYQTNVQLPVYPYSDDTTVSYANLTTTIDNVESKTNIFNASLWLGWPDALLRFDSYDYDSGGEIDLSEWANLRNRFDPLDDSSSCGDNLDPDPSSGQDSLAIGPVDWASETQQLYLRGLTGLAGSVPEVLEIDPVDLPEFEASTVPSRETLVNQLLPRFQATMERGQLAALRELMQPLPANVALPRFALPSTTVQLGDNTTTIDLSALSFGFEDTTSDSRISPFFRFLYMLIQLGLLIVTAWQVKNLLFSTVVDLPQDGLAPDPKT